MPVKSIRLRLALWYAASLALVLIVFAFSTYYFVRSNLFAQLDQRLDAELILVEQALEKPLDEFKELEMHGVLNLFVVDKDDWPLYISDKWGLVDLNYALNNAPLNSRWIWHGGDEQYFHLKQKKVDYEEHQYTLTVALDSTLLHNSLQRLLITFMIATPLALLGGLAGGHFMAGRTLAPIQQLTSRARAIGAENLSERLVVHNENDELGQLTQVLNDMFARIDTSFDQLKRFTQDAAHELRTPLTVLRSVGEVGLQEQREPNAYREIIVSMLEEVDRLGRLVDGLLTLARAESGRISVQRQPENVTAICREVVDCLRVLAEEKHQLLSMESNEVVTASVDRDTLRLAMMNLIANAISFTPAYGNIGVRLFFHDVHMISIEVQDNGPGIGQEHHARLFERFYRVDPSRAQQTGGTGLGLAITLWAVEVNGGQLVLDSAIGKGSVFRIILPASNAKK